MKTYFVTTWKFTDEILLALHRAFRPAWHRAAAAAVALIFAILSIFCFQLGFHTPAVLALAGVLLYPLAVNFQNKAGLSKIKQALMKRYENDMPLMTSTFDEEKIIILNEGTGGKVTIKYNAVTICRETGQYFFLLTREENFAVADKNHFLIGSKEDFPSFLKAKIPQAKYILPAKKVKKN